MLLKRHTNGMLSLVCHGNNVYSDMAMDILFQDEFSLRALYLREMVPRLPVVGTVSFGHCRIDVVPNPPAVLGVTQLQLAALRIRYIGAVRVEVTHD